jgi:hypothetical protein
MLRGRHAGLGNPLAYSLSRFSCMRRLGRAYRRFSDGGPLPTAQTRALANPDRDDVVRQIRENSYARGFRLDPGVVHEIREFAETTPCKAYPHYGRGKRFEFLKRDWQAAEREHGRKIVLGRIRDNANCPALQRLEREHCLHEIAASYFGYWPNWVESRLYWSFVRHDLDPVERARSGQNVLFHYDLCGFRWCYLFFQFYLTDVDAGCGPLVLVRGSHRPKSLRLLLGSANHSEEVIAEYYHRDNFVMLTGAAGDGFVMDGYCFHRATAPTTGERLFLQIRMS